MHETRSNANGDNELYTPHNGRPRACSWSAPYFLYLLTYLIPRINSTPGSRLASLQNGPCTPTMQQGLKKKIIMHKNQELRMFRGGGGPHVGVLKVICPSLIRF